MQLFECYPHFCFRLTLLNDSDLDTQLIASLFLLILSIKAADDANDDSDIDWSNSPQNSDSDSHSINPKTEAKTKSRNYTKQPSDKGNNYLYYAHGSSNCLRCYHWNRNSPTQTCLNYGTMAVIYTIHISNYN